MAAAFGIGITFTLKRLNKENISCISPPKVVEGGKVDTVCFDKTGTLTEEGITLKGILPFTNYNKFHTSILESNKLEEYNWGSKHFNNCISLCHSLITINEELIGDPMEKELFLLS